MFVVRAWLLGAGRGQRALPAARPPPGGAGGSGSPACPQVIAPVTEQSPPCHYRDGSQQLMCQWPLPGGCVFSGLMNRHSTTGSSEPRGPAGGIDGGRRRCRSRAPRGGGLAAFNAREKRRATAWGDEHPPSSLLAGAAPTWEREFEDGCHCREPETLSSLAGGPFRQEPGGPRAGVPALPLVL